MNCLQNISVTSAGIHSAPSAFLHFNNGVAFFLTAKDAERTHAEMRRVNALPERCYGLFWVFCKQPSVTSAGIRFVFFAFLHFFDGVAFNRKGRRENPRRDAQSKMYMRKILWVYYYHHLVIQRVSGSWNIPVPSSSGCRTRKTFLRLQSLPRLKAIAV